MLDTEEWNKVGKVKADEEVRFTVFNFMFRKGFTEKEQFRKEHFLKEVKGQASNLKGSKPKHKSSHWTLTKTYEIGTIINSILCINNWDSGNLNNLPTITQHSVAEQGLHPGCSESNT